MSENEMEAAEYRYIMSRLQDDVKTLFQIISFLTLSSGVLIGLGVNSKEPFIFLTPFLILIPGTLLMLSNMNEILYMGAYIKHRFESKYSGIRWETYYYIYRDMRERNANGLNFYKRWASDARGYFFIINCLSLLSVGLFIFYRNFEIYSIIFGVFCFSFELIYSVKMLSVYTTSQEEVYLTLFKKIDKKIEGVKEAECHIPKLDL